MATKTLFRVVGEGVHDDNGLAIVDIDGALRLKMGANYVLAEQQASIADATGTADSITRINLIIDAMQAHGLIA